MRKLVVAGGVAACLLAVCVFESFQVREPRSKTNYTVSVLVHLLQSFYALSAADRQTLLLTIPPNADSLTVNRQVVTFFSGGDHVKWRDEPLPTNGLFRDAWGIPFCFLLTNSASISNVNPALRYAATDLPFVVWSVGQNGTNEFGWGDDLSAP